MKTNPATGLFFQSHLVLCFTSGAAEIHISFLPMLIFEIHMGFQPRVKVCVFTISIKRCLKGLHLGFLAWQEWEEFYENDVSFDVGLDQ
jgi:hypothetical protein